MSAIIHHYTVPAHRITWSHHCQSSDNLSWHIVPTVHGYVVVSVWVDSHDPRKDATEIRMVHQGLLHTRYISGKAYSERYSGTLARRFATEIVNRNQAQEPSPDPYITQPPDGQFVIIRP